MGSAGQRGAARRGGNSGGLTPLKGNLDQYGEATFGGFHGFETMHFTVGLSQPVANVG